MAQRKEDKMGYWEWLRSIGGNIGKYCKDLKPMPKKQEDKIDHNGMFCYNQAYSLIHKRATYV